MCVAVRKPVLEQLNQHNYECAVVCIVLTRLDDSPSMENNYLEHEDIASVTFPTFLVFLLRDI